MCLRVWSLVPQLSVSALSASTRAQTLGHLSSCPSLRGLCPRSSPQRTDAPLAPHPGGFLPAPPHRGWSPCQLPQFLAQQSTCLLEFTVQGWRKGPHQTQDHVALQKVPVERKETHSIPPGSGENTRKASPWIGHLDTLGEALLCINRE